MPKRMSDSKYFKASMMINIWLGYFPDLTSTEAKRMLHQTYLNEDQIPTRSRIISMISEKKKIKEGRFKDFTYTSKREQRTFEIAMRNSLLDLVAKDPSLQGLRDNSDYEKEFKFESEKIAKKRKKIAGSFRDTFREGLIIDRDS